MLRKPNGKLLKNCNGKEYDKIGYNLFLNNIDTSIFIELSLKLKIRNQKNHLDLYTIHTTFFLQEL